MNIDIEMFKNLALKCDDNDEILSSSLSGINNVISGDLDRRLMENNKKERLYEIQDDLNKLTISNEELRSASQFAYNVFTDTSQPVLNTIGSPTFDMKLNRDGIPWAEINYVPKNDIIEEPSNVIDINSLSPEVKNYIEKLYKDNPYLTTLKPDALSNLINDINTIMLMKSMFLEYEKNRDETLSLLAKIKEYDEEISSIREMGINQNTYDKEKVKLYESISEEDLIIYYNKVNTERQPGYDETLYYMGQYVSFKQENLKKIYDLNSNISSIEQINEIENNYSMLLSFENNLPLSYLKQTAEFEEFLKFKESGNYEPISFNIYNPLFGNDDHKYATPEEMETYEFLYYKYGNEEALEFLDEYLLDQVNMRKGYEEASKYLGIINDNNFFAQMFYTGTEGLQDGVEQFFGGINNLFNPSSVNSPDSYKSMFIVLALENKILETYFNKEEVAEIRNKLSTGEYSQEDVRNLLKENGKDYNEVLDDYVFPDSASKNYVLSKLYSADVSIGNMIPSIAFGLVTGNPLAGSILMGATSMGNAMNSALVGGASNLTAFFYGLCIGVSETTLGYFIGKVPGLSKSAESLGGVKGLKGILAAIFHNAIGETREEGLQFVFESLIFNKVFLGQTISLEDFIKGTTESAAMGFFVSLLMGGAQLSINVGGVAVKLVANQAIELYEALKITDPLLRNQKLIDLGGALGIVNFPGIFGNTNKGNINDDINKIISGQDAKYGKGSGILNLQNFSDPKNPRYKDPTLITSSQGARSILMKYTPDQISAAINSTNLSGAKTNYTIRRSAQDVNNATVDQIRSNGNMSKIELAVNKGGDPYHSLVSILSNNIAKATPNISMITNFFNRFNQLRYTAYPQGAYFYHIMTSNFNSSNIQNRLYINNQNLSDTLTFATLFANKCEERGIPYRFKIPNMKNGIENMNPFGLIRDETIVVYSSDEYLADYVNICNEIKLETNMKFLKPPILSGSIDGFIGYGAEPRESGVISYNQLRSDLTSEAVRYVNQTLMDKYPGYEINYILENIRKNSTNYEKYLNEIKKYIDNNASRYGIDPAKFFLNSK